MTRAPALAAALPLALLAAALGCAQPPRPAADSGVEAPDAARAEADAGVDSLNARIARAYRAADPEAYGTLYTDSAVFEWPAFDTVRGRAALAAMARGNWAALRDMDLRLAVASRRHAPGHATEHGAFQQEYTDAAGARMTEYGRYVAVLVRQDDGRWLMDRFFGFSDSTRATPRRP